MMVPMVLLTLPTVSWTGALERAINGTSSVLDLTYPLNGRTLAWPELARPPKGPLHRLASLEELGTHLEAPAHLFEGKPTIERIPFQQLIGPAILVDVTRKVEKDQDYRLIPEDLRAWERKYGKIPSGAFVLAYTGWGRRFWEKERYRNLDGKGVMHFPGFSTEAVTFLLNRRKIKGIGIDTLSVDHGPSQDFPVHRLLFSAGKVALEGLANLDKLPPKGVKLIIAPLPLKGSSVAPTRIFAILP